MLRPGGFPEYTPREQKIFDILYAAIAQNFSQYGYQHIHTPAVEAVDTLKKGGDEVSKQIFGLYGLAQGPEDAKDYALHFDLTVPFARYVLDNQNELAFPFKRYQIQPVRRGERSQKGRYKEFRQADIDAIWKSNSSFLLEGMYCSDIIYTLAKTLSTIFDRLNIKDTIVIHVNDKRVIKKFLQSLDLDEEQINSVISLLDKYYKLDVEEFKGNLNEIIKNETKLNAILYGISEAKNHFDGIIEAANLSDWLDIIKEDGQVYKSLPIDGLRTIIKDQKKLGLNNVKIIFDPTIVRGLDYYTGTVFETFIEDRQDLGSICSGGAYANLTEFLDPKQSFSGVGGSIGLSRLMSVLVEEYDIVNTFVPQDASYLILNEEKTNTKAQDVVTKLRAQHNIVELYPLPEKLDKQFKYAEKKGLSYVVQIFDDGVKYKKLGGNWEDLSI